MGAERLVTQLLGVGIGVGDVSDGENGGVVGTVGEKVLDGWNGKGAVCSGDDDGARHDGSLCEAEKMRMRRTS